MTGKSYAQPSITYTPVSASCVSGDVVVSGVTIADAVGVPTAGANVPRLYVKKNSGAWVSAPGVLTSGTGVSGTWDFSVTSASLGTLFASNIVSYFIIAENTSSAVSANPGAGLSASDVNTITTFPSSPYTYTVNSLPTITSLIASPNTICVGLPFNLNAGVVTGSGTLISYNWSGPDGFSTTGSAPTSVLTPTTTAATGIYSVNVTYPGSGCTSNTRTATVTVNGAMPSVSGASTLCASSTTPFTIATTGGGWFSSNTGVASISSTTGIATGIAAGTTTISYIKGNCYATAVLTVNSLPSPITGPSAVCVGSTIPMANADAGGNWTSSNPAYATVTGGGGVVSGLSNGTINITYTLPTGCLRTYPVTVNVVPTAITGTMVVCEGSTTNLSSTPTGGTWSTSNSSVATVAISSGAVNGVAAGTATISYIMGGSSGCVVTSDVTVNPLPAPITGPSTVCVGFTNTLSDVTPLGVWSTGNPAVATIDVSGVVTGHIASTVAMSYTLPTGCATTTIMIVNATPSAIALPHSVCVGSNISFSSLPTGSWSSSDVTTATVVSPAGTVTGVAVGTAIISNILSTGCYSSTVVTVNQTPPAITGTPFVCVGSSTTLANALPGGIWSTVSTGVLSVNPATGMVTSISAGIVQVKYSFATGCSAAITVTANPSPSITGASTLCEGNVSVLTSSSPGGTWTSSSPVTATVGSSTGLVNGLVAGTTTMSYMAGNGCSASRVMTVNMVPAPITGTMSTCVGTSTFLSNATPGGSWNSSAPGTAFVHSITGNVTGMSAGTASISYKLSTGCLSSTVFSVDPIPASIAGSSLVCLGSSSTLTSTSPGGGWSTSNAAIVSVDLTGVITGNALGTAIIYYTSAAGCVTSKVATVNPVPAPIGGSSTACTGAATSLTNAFLGGGWSSSDNLIATISGAGSLTGISVGTVDITYTLPNTCFVTTNITVNASPSPITGVTNACVGSTSLLSNSTPGGTWNSSNIAAATVDGSTGLVSGIAVGTSTVSYTLGNGCKASVVFSVNTLPTPITGVPVICEGASTVLISVPAAGSWTTSSPFVAVVSTGVVTGLGAGVATVSYVLGNGCFATKDVTVNAVPPASTGVPVTCIGSTTTLSNAAPGGTWTSSFSLVASVDPLTGVVTGVAAGSVKITYTLTTGCKTLTSVSVNSLPAAIGGVGSVCQGLSTTLTNSTTGGTWSSQNTGIAIVGSGSGVVVGIAPGTTTISYTVSSTGCYRTKVATVDPLPAAIAGTPVTCVGSSVTLTNPTLGGTWSSSNTSIATIGSTTGILTGVALGVVNITYKMSTGCQVITPATVNLLPAALVGVSNVCVGSNTVFTSSTPGGTWSSSNGAIATVGTDGVIAGVSNGVAFISYTMSTSCFVVRAVTVNGLPSPIAGTISLCQGTTSNLSSLTPGGTWTSSTPGIATVGFNNGIVNGLFPGTTTIVYTASTGCTSSVIVTVNPIPVAIAGITNLCLGSTTSLTSLSPGGAWSTGNPVVATVGAATGVVSGNSLGTAPITYILPTGCRTSVTVTVSAVPANILGVPTLCVGGSTTLYEITAGGTWSSTDNTIATVTSAGIVNGINAGNATISYTLPTGCAKTLAITVNPEPQPIVETAAVCIGTSMTLTSPTPGGIWVSSFPSRAIIDVSTGVLTGVTSGTSTITYSLPTGCKTYTIATVNSLPTAITGPLNICSGSSATLTNGVAGGIWSSDNILIATIAPGTGVVTGTGLGADTIRYTLPGSCEAKIVVTVTPAPPSIAGSTTTCAGQTSLLTNAVVGGTWSSSNPAVASIDLGSGLVTAYTAGTANITYTLGVGCSISTGFVVNPAASPITGPNEVCMGHSVALYNSASGGDWTSSDPSVASVDLVTGLVTGIANNTVTIYYTLPGGCSATFLMTVHSTPPPIGGPDAVCLGLTETLTNGSPFSGIWTSSDPTVAPIGLTSGIVSGISVGTATVTYTILGTGCYREKVVSVNPSPGPIAGSTYVCEGSYTTLFPTSTGGTWTSSDLAIASVGSITGIVSGLAPGGATISYTLPTGCIATAFVVVNPIPPSITGTTEICTGSTTTYANAQPFGTWSSNNTSIVTIDATSGVATAVSPGLATISYTLLATGCYITQQVSVDPVPPPIVGTPFMCINGSTFLSNPLSGGSWSSSNPLVATIDGVGNVTSTGTGTTTITYTLTSACYITRLVTVEPTLNAITGPSNVCAGSSMPYSNDYVGGIWASSNTATATVGTTGIVLGVSAGAVDITYKTPVAGCYVIKAVTVDPIPSAVVSSIPGEDTLCVGTTLTMTTLSSGGTWSTTDVSVATITSGGLVTGISANTVIVSYTIGTGCASTLELRVKALANAGTISGPAEVCIDNDITLVSTSDEGIWSSGDATIATVDAAGVVHGVGVGTVVISYIATNDCSADTATFSVLVKPAPFAGVLSGNTGLCINYSTTLSSTVAGGVWSSSNTTVATINASGVVTGLVAGTTVVSYAVTTSCGTDVDTIVITVNVMAPHTNISVHPDSVLCSKAQFQNFGADQAPPTGLGYAWSATNAEVYATSPDKQNAVVNFNDPGVAVVRLTTQITNTGCFVTDSFTVVVNDAPAYTPEVKYYGEELICTDNTSTSYQWGYDDAITLDSTLIPGAIQQSFYLPVPDFSGKRYWVIAQRDGCFQKVYYNKPTDVEPIAIGMIDVRLFPNPTNSMLNIEVNGANSADQLSIRLVDMMGREIESSVLVRGRGMIDASRLSSGVYSVIFIQNGIKVTSKTFVKN
jgi:uncharacterized protein YjdB